MLDTTQPQTLRPLLQRHGFTFAKALGQNFLTVPWVCEDMVDALPIDRDTGVLEIGPGAGALTTRLAQRAGHVTALELDARLLPLLAEVLDGASHTQVVQGDVLKTDLAALLAGWPAVKRKLAVANLPYYITSPVILQLLDSRLFDGLCVMVQKEVVARLTARPGDQALTAFSLEVQLQAEVRPLFGVGRNCFLPEPHVDSAVVQLTPHSADKQPTRRCLQLVRAGYAMRRKTLLNNLTPLLGKEQAAVALSAAGIPPQARAETLTPDDWRRLAASAQ